LLVLNGPNLNLLGEREPATYGSTSFGDLEKQLQHEADQLGVELILRQSNLEGDLISLIQQARLWADGIVLNPGGYTHTSVAMRDAIAGMTLPVVEVHLTDIAVREPFRRESLISPVCAKVISGKGIIGYVEAIKALQAMIKVASLGEQTMGTRDIQQ
jgi:3-dehydroquinate dehydratase-2